MESDMFSDVEDILDFWDNTGLLRSATDRCNLALILHTQNKINKTTKHYHDFKRCSIPTLAGTIQVCPDLFMGLLETQDCTDVFRLGPIPRGTDMEICEEVSRRLLEVHRDLEDSGTPYFGGIVAKNGKLYLLIDQED